MEENTPMNGGKLQTIFLGLAEYLGNIQYRIISASFPLIYIYIYDDSTGAPPGASTSRFTPFLRSLRANVPLRCEMDVRWSDQGAMVPCHASDQKHSLYSLYQKVVLDDLYDPNSRTELVPGYVKAPASPASYCTLRR